MHRTGEIPLQGSARAHVQPAVIWPRIRPPSDTTENPAQREQFPQRGQGLRHDLSLVFDAPDDHLDDVPQLSF
jgi:hypothetical protein